MNEATKDVLLELSTARIVELTELNKKLKEENRAMRDQLTSIEREIPWSATSHHNIEVALRQFVWSRGQK